MTDELDAGDLSPCEEGSRADTRGVDAGTPAASFCRANVANPAPVLATVTSPSGGDSGRSAPPTPPQAAVAVFGPRRAEPRPSGRSSSSKSGGHVVSGTDKGFAYDDGHHGQRHSFRSPPRRHRVLRHGPLAGPATTSSRRADVRANAPANATPGSLIAALDVVFSQVRWRYWDSINDVLLQRQAKDPGLDLALGHWSSQADPRKATSVAAV